MPISATSGTARRSPGLLKVAATLLSALLAACGGTGTGLEPAHTGALPATTGQFATFVDEFLDHFARHHPSIAAGNGIHQYDGRLEDFSGGAISAEIAAWRGLQTKLAAIPVSTLTPDERVDHRIVGGLIDAWLLELDTNKNW